MVLPDDIVAATSHGNFLDQGGWGQIDAYAKATNPQRVARGGHLDIPGALAAQKCEREWPEERSRVAGWCLD